MRSVMLFAAETSNKSGDGSRAAVSDPPKGIRDSHSIARRMLQILLLEQFDEGVRNSRQLAATGEPLLI